MQQYFKMSLILTDILKNKKVILASSSVSRQGILKTMDINLEICPSTFEENLNIEEFKSISDFVEETALQKVLQVSRTKLINNNSDLIFIGADTVVSLENKMFCKPKNENEAFSMLKLLSGKMNTVYTGVVIKINDDIIKFTEKTDIFITTISDEEIWNYISSGEPMKYCGAFAVQGLGGQFIKKINGNYHNILGLPLNTIFEKLKNHFNNKNEK